MGKASFGNTYDLPAITKKEIKKVLSNGFIIGIEDKTKLLSNIQVMERKRLVLYIWNRHYFQKQEVGLADKLLKKAIKMVKEKNAKKITTTIKPDNTKSTKLFEKNDFKIKKLVPAYYGKGKPAKSHKTFISRQQY